jgi:Flp pilus assembly protein TadB
VNGNWRAVDCPQRGDRVLTLFLFLVIVAIVLGIIGVVVNGLGYLLVIAVAVFAADLIVIAMRWSRRIKRRPLR